MQIASCNMLIHFRLWCDLVQGLPNSFPSFFFFYQKQDHTDCDSFLGTIATCIGGAGSGPTGHPLWSWASPFQIFFCSITRSLGKQEAVQFLIFVWIVFPNNSEPPYIHNHFKKSRVQQHSVPNRWESPRLVLADWIRINPKGKKCSIVESCSRGWKPGKLSAEIDQVNIFELQNQHTMIMHDSQFRSLNYQSLRQPNAKV